MDRDASVSLITQRPEKYFRSFLFKAIV